MIKGNTILFGYGDICVGSRHYPPALTIQGIEPSVSLGAAVTEDIKSVGELLQFHLNIQDSIDLSRLLNMVKHRVVDMFEFKGYIFDFTNFHIDSVNVCFTHLRNATYNQQLGMAS